jgi:hypothetical protein
MAALRSLTSLNVCIGLDLQFLVFLSYMSSWLVRYTTMVPKETVEAKNSGRFGERGGLG